jgi:WD40 repeat protein
VVREYPGHKGLIRGVAISDDGALVASVSHQGAIQVNRRADGGLVVRFVQEKREFNAVCFTRQGDGLLVVSGDGRVLFHRFGEKVVRTIHLQKGIQFWGLARLPDARRFLVGGTDGKLLEIDTARPGRARVVVEIGQAITELAVNERSGLVLIGTGKIQSRESEGNWAEPADYPLILVDPVKGMILGRFSGHKDLVRSLVWAEDGQQVFSASLDGQDLRWTVLGLARQGR